VPCARYCRERSDGDSATDRATRNRGLACVHAAPRNRSRSRSWTSSWIDGCARSPPGRRAGRRPADRPDHDRASKELEGADVRVSIAPPCRLIESAQTRTNWRLQLAANRYRQSARARHRAVLGAKGEQLILNINVEVRSVATGEPSTSIGRYPRQYQRTWLARRAQTGRNIRTNHICVERSNPKEKSP